jgi:hypothetical protein
MGTATNDAPDAAWLRRPASVLKLSTGMVGSVASVLTFRQSKHDAGEVTPRRHRPRLREVGRRMQQATDVTMPVRPVVARWARLRTWRAPAGDCFVHEYDYWGGEYQT